MDALLTIVAALAGGLIALAGQFLAGRHEGSRERRRQLLEACATKGTRLQTIAGTVPELADLPAGCVFADRCEIAEARCRVIFPPPVTVNAGHTVRCLRTDVSMTKRVGAAIA